MRKDTRPALIFGRVWDEASIFSHNNYTVRLFIFLMTKFCVQVSAAPPPTIPKQPLLPALEAPPSLDTLMLEYPSPSSSLSSRSPSHSPAYSLHSHTSSYHSDIERGGAAAEGERRPDWTKPEGEENNEQQGVFLTQVN